MDWKTFEEKEENSCKTFDVKFRSFKMYHMQVSQAKAFYPCNVNSIKALLIPVHWQVLGRKLQCGVRDMKTRTNAWAGDHFVKMRSMKDSSVTTLKSLEDKADSGSVFLLFKLNKV